MRCSGMRSMFGTVPFPDGDAEAGSSGDFQLADD